MGHQDAKMEIFRRIRTAFPLFIIIPAVISIANTLLGQNCSLTDGTAFYTVIVLPAIIIGVALGGLSFLLSRRAPSVIFVAILLAVALIPLFEFYFNPQVYFYNPLIGYFPGTIYDEGLSVGGLLVVYRFLNIIFFGAVIILLYTYFFTKRRIRRSYILTFVVVISAAFIAIAPYLRLSTTQNQLKKELSGTIETEHFSIHYSPRINKRLIKVIAIHHEYYYGELAKYFNYAPDEKIYSYIFASADQKGALFGSTNADVAKPWLLQIYTTYHNYNKTLRHEIAHCFTAGFGKGLLKIADNFNPALIEGAATAADPMYDENYIHSMAALAYKNGYKIKLEELFNYLNFFRQNSSLSYIYAGSFSDYLVQNYGIEKFKKLYTDIDFPAIYGKPVVDIVKNYYQFLNSLNNKDSRDAATYYFGRKAIIQKDCPRYVYDRLNIAWQLVDEKKYKEAQTIFKEVLSVSNEYSALIGLVACMTELEEKESSVQLILDNLEHYRNTSYYYNIEFKLGDLFVHLDMKDKADSLYRKIEEQSPNRSLAYLASLRRILISEEDNLINYLKGSDFDKYSILKRLNQKFYSYSSFPVLTDLSRELNEDYNLFKKQFDKTFFVNDYASSYALYRISQYMLENRDFKGAMRIAAFAGRYNNDDNFNFVLEDNFRKAEWFFRNGDKMFEQLNSLPD
jgi:predicted negative regulator of RcsB-dependent stress response